MSKTTVFIPSAKGPVRVVGEMKGDGFYGIPERDGYTTSQFFSPGSFFITENEAKPLSIKLIDKRLKSIETTYNNQKKTLEEMKASLAV